MPQNSSRLDAKQWRHEYFVRLEKGGATVREFRKWLRENMIGPFRAEVNLLTTYDIVHCNIRDEDDAVLFMLKWAGMLK